MPAPPRSATAPDDPIVSSGRRSGPLSGRRCHPVKGHLDAGNVTLGMGQELVQFLKRPLAALRFHRCRIVKSRFGRPWPVNHIPQVRADLVGFTLSEGMARHAYPADRLAAIDVGMRETRRDWLFRLCFGCRGGSCRLLLSSDLKSRLGRQNRREQRRGKENSDAAKRWTRAR